MSIMPSEGWVSPSENLQRQLSQENAGSACPSCYSTDWKSASLVYHEGLSLLNSRTTGVVAGVGRIGLRHSTTAVGGAIYQGSTSGVTQTMLSRMAAPPQKRTGLTTFLKLLFIVLGCSAIIGTLSTGLNFVSIVMGLIAVVLMCAAKAVNRGQQRIHEAAMYVYESTKMCVRCGAIYSTRASGGYIEDSSTGDLSDTSLLFIGMFGLAVLCLGAALIHSAPPVSQEHDATSSATGVQPAVASDADEGGEVKVPALLTERDSTPFAASAVGLVASYDADPITADARYRSRSVILTGVVTGVFIPSIETSMRLADKGGAKAFVTMAGPVPSSAAETLFLPGVHASSADGPIFGEQESEEADRLEVGESVTLECTVEQFSRVSDLTGSRRPGWPDAQIALDDCILKHSIKVPEQKSQDASTATTKSSDESPHVAPIVRMSPAENQPSQPQ